ncbi:MAG: alpha/beta hydrolase [Thermomicrobiales bacterium]
MTSSRRLRRIIGLMLALVLLVSCNADPSISTATPLPPTSLPVTPTFPASLPTAMATPEPQALPRFDMTVCPFALPAGEVLGKTVDCGYLIVPERRDAPQSPTVRLALARFRAMDGNVDGGPWVYVAGGWGNSVQGLVSNTTGSFRREATTHHDFIVYDQRGVGLSQPSLTCPELGDTALAAYQQPTSAGSSVPPAVAAASHCHDRLVQQGIDVTAYTSVEDAADLNDLRVALGYRQLNLSGISYGTVRALTVMRDFPDAVRSAVLDSTAPLQTNLITDWGGNFDRALRLLFARCVADSRCHSAYPTLESDFSQVVAQLNAAPASITITDPKSGQSYPLVITGTRLVPHHSDYAG